MHNKPNNFPFYGVYPEYVESKPTFAPSFFKICHSRVFPPTRESFAQSVQHRQLKILMDKLPSSTEKKYTSLLNKIQHWNL